MAFMGAKGDWQEIDSQSVNANTNHVSFHFLEIAEKYKLIFYNNSKIIQQQEFECIDHDMPCNLTPDTIDITVKFFGLSASVYISPSIFDLNYNINDYNTISNPMSLEWITKTDKDWMWYAVPDNINNMENEALFLKLLLLNGLFALPHGSVAKKLIDYFGEEAQTNAKIKMMIKRYSQQIMLCPNPENRQVIDFRVNKDIKQKEEHKLNDQEINEENDINMLDEDQQHKKQKKSKKKKKKKKKNRTRIEQQNMTENTVNSKWGKNKKLKRYKKDFYLSINYKFKEHLILCKDYHIEKEFEKAQREKEKEKQEQKENDSNIKNKNENKNKDKNEKEMDKEDGTWITNNFIEILDKLRQNEKDGDVLKFVTFELWEKETNEIVAASFAYITGSIVCDYTFMTLKRDHRSCGSILTKVVGHILQSCKYDFWYWGFRLDYMTDYDKYGGKEINRKEFASILINSCKKAPNMIVNCNDEPIVDITEFIKTGKALIAPLPQWINQL